MKCMNVGVHYILSLHTSTVHIFKMKTPQNLSFSNSQFVFISTDMTYTTFLYLYVKILYYRDYQAKQGCHIHFKNAPQKYDII